MNIKEYPKLSAWSASRYNTYKVCPSQIKFEVHERLKKPQNDAMTRGNDVHKEAELFIKDELETPTLWPPAGIEVLQDVKSKGAVAEDQWTFTKDWKETTWFSFDAWLRIKVDAYYMDAPDHMVIIDWKTGKIRPGYEDQLSLYALGAFKIFEDRLNTIEVFNYYVDHDVWRGGEDEGFVFKRENLKDLELSWAKKVDKMLHDQTFDPTPNTLCKWCHYRHSNGGPCSYG